MDRLHEDLVFPRRIRVLSEHLAALIPRGARVLDVGCGGSALARSMMQCRPDIAVEGVDVLVRPDTHIPVRAFDGTRLPQGDASVDVVMFVDVIHHTHDPLVLLREAVRVTRRDVVLKDHLREGWLASPTLRFMDYVGNARHGVALPYNYWTWEQWQSAFRQLPVELMEYRKDLGIYPSPARWLFDRSLHFVARLQLALPAR